MPYPKKYMPITFWTYLIGYLAISGIPPFSGFWSKDDVLASAWHKSPALWAVGVVTAGLTAYYMSRQVVLVFAGEARWEEHAAAHGAAGTAGLVHGAAGAPTHEAGAHVAPLVGAPTTRRL